MSATGVCDFCRAPLVGTWTRYGCRKFERTVHGNVETARVVMLGFWAACRACSPMVEGRRWRDLAQRALRAEERRAGRVHRRQRGAFLSELVGMYLQVEQHLTGDVRQVVA